MPPPITLTSPLPPADLLFQSMNLSTGLSTLGEMQLNLLSPKADLKADDLLGQQVTVTVELRDEAKRHFNGHVTRFGMSHHEGRHYLYQATVRPWLWFLTRTTDCRIFQDLSVPDIVKKVLEDHPVANFEFKLFRHYRKRVYCVQYRESDFNFVARLLEEEGIYWYFEHTDTKHKLVLVDSRSVHSAAPGCEELPFFANAAEVPPDTEYVSNCSFSQEVRTGKVVLTSYDFERPSTSLEVEEKVHQRDYKLSDYEQFDYQGDFVQRADGEQLAENELDETQTRFARLRGTSNAHALETGRLLKMRKHPRDEQNVEYLLTATAIHAQVSAYESGSSSGAGDFQCDFQAIPSEQQFRPARRTPKPFVQGPQSAVVTGPSGDEIFTDKYGRVKLQFHWDRYGKKNDKSSCWVRVSHPWAGKNFGIVDIPRIGQEVIVDFLEGDPDQPLITGRVYNAEQMPPWDLPANATQSGILTRSSKGGGYGNANAIRFEDKAGSEQVWIHAEKNQDIEVEHDETHWVGHDRKKTIDHDETNLIKHDRTETVDNDETVTVHHDRTERVDNDETISIGRDRSMSIERDKSEMVLRNKSIEVTANHTEDIGASMYVNVGGSLSESVSANYAETVGAAMEITVGAAMAITVGAAMAETVGGVKSENVGGTKTEVVGGNKSINVGGDLSENVSKNVTSQIEQDLKETIGGQHVVSVTKEHVLNAKKIQFVGADEIVLKCGSAEITMKKNGDINIKGNKISIKGSGDVVVKGSKVLEN